MPMPPPPEPPLTPAAREADPAARKREVEAAALVPPVLDILALSFAAPAHSVVTSSGAGLPDFYPLCMGRAARQGFRPWAGTLRPVRR